MTRVVRVRTADLGKETIMVRTYGFCGALLAIGLAGPVLADDTATGEGLFEPPVRLQSESGEINLRVRMEGVARSGRGYAGPHVTDFDADGTPDLLVGDIFGNIFYFRGLDNDSAAAYADPVPVRMADGDVLVLNNW